MISNTGINKPQGTTSKTTDPGTPLMGVDANSIYRLLKVDTDGSIIVSNTLGTTNLRVEVDQVSSSLTYVGYAAYNALVTEAKWLIFRLQLTGTVTNKSFANTSVAYDKIWNNRATYTYL
jgi:hypothetical protein